MVIQVMEFHVQIMMSVLYELIIVLTMHLVQIQLEVLTVHVMLVIMVMV